MTAAGAQSRTGMKQSQEAVPSARTEEAAEKAARRRVGGRRGRKGERRVEGQRARPDQTRRCRCATERLTVVSARGEKQEKGRAAAQPRPDASSLSSPTARLSHLLTLETRNR